MRILLIMPDAHMHKLRIGPFVRSMREAPLTLTTLAALVPNDPDINLKLVDGSVDAIPRDYPADLVGISVITGCAPAAYERCWAGCTSPSCPARPARTPIASSSAGVKRHGRGWLRIFDAGR
jgi:hypothetical protein